MPKPKSAGRPVGSLCSWYTTKDGKVVRCRRSARVKVTIMLGMMIKPVTVLRCWKHYVAMENSYRGSSNATVIKAEVL